MTVNFDKRFRDRTLEEQERGVEGYALRSVHSSLFCLLVCCFVEKRP